MNILNGETFLCYQLAVRVAATLELRKEIYGQQKYERERERERVRQRERERERERERVLTLIS